MRLMKLFWKGQDNPAMLASGARYNYLGFNDVLPKLLGITGKLVYQPVSRRGSLGLYTTCFSSGLCCPRGYWSWAFECDTEMALCFRFRNPSCDDNSKIWRRAVSVGQSRWLFGWLEMD